MFIGLLFVFGFVIPIAYVIGTYNGFIRRRADIREMWSNVKTEYQRRIDLMINVVASVKSYKKFEKSTLKEVTAMRRMDMPNLEKLGMTKGIKTMQGLDAVFSKLLAVFEAYPDLKAIQQYNKFSDEMAETENRINIARTSYNELVRVYNVDVDSFPSNIIAKVFRFGKEFKYFERDKEVEKGFRARLD